MVCAGRVEIFKATGAMPLCTMSAVVAMRKYFEMSGWLLTSRRSIRASSIERITSS